MLLILIAPDERIIIFGGGQNGNQLAVLNTKTNPYEWSIPQVTGVNIPPTAFYGSATLVGNYMFINFGKLINIIQTFKK